MLTSLPQCKPFRPVWFAILLDGQQIGFVEARDALRAYRYWRIGHLDCDVRLALLVLPF